MTLWQYLTITMLWLLSFDDGDMMAGGGVDTILDDYDAIIRCL